MFFKTISWLINGTYNLVSPKKISLTHIYTSIVRLGSDPNDLH
jgi:hypothetical protein